MSSSLTLIWQATQCMFNQFDTSATILTSAGFSSRTMFRVHAIGKIFGGLSVAFGAAQIVEISRFSTNSDAYAPFALLTFLIFPILFEWKLYRLSKVV